MEASLPIPRRTNWSMIFRVGTVVTIVGLLLGYALYQTFVIVFQGGVIKRGDYYEVNLKSMSNFEMNQLNGTLEDIPQPYRKLDGQKVLLEGEVAPTGMGSGDKVNQFLLCYSVAKCCFGGPPKVQHFVHCKAPDGKMVSNYDGAGTVRVFGTLHVRIKKGEGGKIQSIYELDLDRVEPVS